MLMKSSHVLVELYKPFPLIVKIVGELILLYLHAQGIVMNHP